MLSEPQRIPEQVRSTVATAERDVQVAPVEV